MLIPSKRLQSQGPTTSLSRRVNANSQQLITLRYPVSKLIKKGEC